MSRLFDYERAARTNGSPLTCPRCGMLAVHVDPAACIAALASEHTRLVARIVRNGEERSIVALRSVIAELDFAAISEKHPRNKVPYKAGKEREAHGSQADTL